MRTDGQRIEPATTDEQILRCFAMMTKLRQHLTEDGFIEQVRRQQTESSRRLAFLKDAGTQCFEAQHFSQVLS